MFLPDSKASIASFLMLTLVGIARAQDAVPASQPAGVGKLPHIVLDAKSREIRVDCEMVGVKSPLEFFCVVAGTAEHESILRSPVKPSDLHFSLLALGLVPGSPVRYSEAAKKWTPPHGPPLHLFVEFQKDGQLVKLPAYRLMRDVKTHKEMPPLTWIFSGSRVMDDGVYGADGTGYIVSIVNFELSPIDVPQLASSANETLEWECNPDIAPAAGTAVTMILQPAGDGPPQTAPATQPAQPLSEVQLDQAKVDRMTSKWQQAVAPHREALKEAAQAHYEVIGTLRREQQRLIDEADRVQRTIDQLEKDYQDMTTPRPEMGP